MIAIRMIRIQIANTASGLRLSLFMPSRKKVVDSAMTSACRFSSSVALSNFSGFSCRLHILFFGAGIS